MYGVCVLPVVACRAEPSEKSEMVTQLLFGEWVEILEHYQQWMKCRSVYDRYVFWVSSLQIEPMEDYDKNKIWQLTGYLLPNPVNLLIPKDKDQPNLVVPSGSRVWMNEDGQPVLHRLVFENEDLDLIPEDKLIDDRSAILSFALQFLGTPYLWGGRTLMGMDCSGFTQLVYKLCNIFLPRDAYQQAEMGETVNFLEEALPGDLAFFDNEQGRIVHVGILMENFKIIHCSGKVRIDDIDHYGIYNRELKKYTHHLRIIKKML